MSSRAKKSGKKVRRPKRCKGCRNWFVPKRDNQKYCNDTCREAYYAIHYPPPAPVQKICPECGDVFLTTMPKKQSYCKPGCREAAAVRRRQGEPPSEVTLGLLQLRYDILHRDEYRCVLCGGGRDQRKVLEVVNEPEQGLITMCSDCCIGGNPKSRNSFL